jgi:hypothetical protein
MRRTIAKTAASLSTAALIVALTTGCDDRQAADYDRFSHQLTIEMFASLADSDRKTATAKLDRLLSLNPEADNLSYIRRELQDDAVIEKAAAVVADGNLKAGMKVLETAIRSDGATPRLMSERMRLDAVIAAERYQGRKPFRTSAQAREAVKRLPAPRVFGPHAETYQKWVDSQQAMVEKMAAEERRRVAESLVQRFEKAAVAGSSDIEGMIDALGRLDAEHDLFLAWERMRAGRYDIDAAKQAISREATLYAMMNRVNSAQRKKAMDWFARNRPTTLVGRAAGVKADIASGRIARGLAEYTALRKEVPELDIPGLREIVNKTYPVEQRRSLAPTVDSMLRHVYDAAR